MGISFGEKLLGQAISTVPGAGVTGDSDEITGTPTVPLALDTSIPGEFGVVVRDDQLWGLGPLGHPVDTAVGEGAITTLYAIDQKTIAFDMANGTDFDIHQHRFSGRNLWQQPSRELKR